jgi:hypothetical protein
MTISGTGGVPLIVMGPHSMRGFSADRFQSFYQRARQGG